jgi:probable HAF family extracellular repeat protein
MAKSPRPGISPTPRLTVITAALLLCIACDYATPVQPPHFPPPPTPPPAPPPPQPPPPAPVVVEVLTPSRDTATTLGDSLEFVFRVQAAGGAYVPFTLTFSDSSVFTVHPHQTQGSYPAFSLWGMRVGQTIAKITAANVSDSVLISVTAPPPDLAGSPDYEVIDLGTLGGRDAIALALNDYGQVVGSSLTATGERHAFLWENGVMRDLAPDLHGSEASSITNSGVVGIKTIPDPGTIDHRVFVWRDGVRETVGPAWGIVAVGEDGEVVEWYSDDEHVRSFIWRDGAVQYLGGLSMPDVSSAHAMNAHGQIVGSAMAEEHEGDEIPHAFIWENGAIHDLGLLGDFTCEPPPAQGCGYASAYGINSQGAVVGVSSDTSRAAHAVLWADGTIHDLGQGRAIAIDDAGDIIGYSGQTQPDVGTNPDQGGEATFWRAGVPALLGSLGAGRTTIAGLNNVGMVAGSSLTSTGVRHVFMWNQGHMTDLGKGAVAAPAIGAEAVAINSRGDIVGFTYSVRCWFSNGVCFAPGGDPAPTRAILWRRR